jgi:nucleoid-associated protein
MPIEIIHSVIHGFNKEQHGLVTGVIKRPVLLDNDLPAVKDLIASVSTLLGRKSNSQAWGRFGSDGRQGPFPGAFSAFSGNLQDADHFKDLSHLVVDQLVQRATLQALSTGGRILFALYNDEAGRTVLLIAMIKQKGGLVLNEDFVPVGIVEVDLSKLNQAAQIHVEHFIADQLIDIEDEDEDEDHDGQDRNYLSFLSPRSNSEASNYFVDALGCVVGITSAKATDRIFLAVDSFFASNVHLAPFKKKAKEKVVEYLQKQLDADQLATLDDICAVVKQAAPPELDAHFENIIAFLNGPEHKIPDEFKVHESAYKKHARVSLDSERINIKFPRSDLGTGHNAKIGYDKAQRTLIIRELSDEFIAKLDQTLANG